MSRDPAKTLATPILTRQRRGVGTIHDLEAAIRYTWALRTVCQGHLEHSNGVGDHWAGMVIALEALEHDLKSVLNALKLLFRQRPNDPGPPRPGGNGSQRDV